MDGELGKFYDAIENPRASRNELPILRGEELRTYMREVRERTLEVLENADVENDAEDPRMRDGFVYEMLIAHEHQHNETMLQLLQMVDGYVPPVLGDVPAARGETGLVPGEMLLIPGGLCRIGAPAGGFAYDNERPQHEVELADFFIDRAAVTNGEFAEFVAETGAEPPLYWARDDDGWVSTTFGRRAPLDPAAPVVHVDHTQATAFAAHAGKRLPTELEWEMAAGGADPELANLDHESFEPLRPSDDPRAESTWDARAMLGDVWEWTSSDFEAYPGFEPFPYPEYSEVFYGDGYKVLRGGSWATRRNVVRTTFRNWDLAERRQIFAGFRCARDAE